MCLVKGSSKYIMEKNADRLLWEMCMSNFFSVEEISRGRETQFLFSNCHFWEELCRKANPILVGNIRMKSQGDIGNMMISLLLAQISLNISECFFPGQVALSRSSSIKGSRGRGWCGGGGGEAAKMQILPTTHTF